MGLTLSDCCAEPNNSVVAPADTSAKVGTLAEFIEHRPPPPLPGTLAEWEQVAGVDGELLRRRIRARFGLPLLEEELADTVAIREVGEPIAPDGWHYRIRRMALSGVHGIELPVNVYEPTRAAPHAGGFVYITGHTNPSKSWPEGQQLCANLAERGIVAIAVDYFGMGERFQPGNAHNVGTFSYTGLTAIGMELSDGMTAVSYLLQRGDVDPQHIGFTGWSGGGHFTQWMGVADSRVTLVVPCVGTCDYLWMWLRPASSGRDECWHMHPPGFQADCDMGLAFATVAPRRLRIINELNSGGAFDCTHAEALIERARHVFKLYGMPDRCDVRCPDPNHDYSPGKQAQLFEVVNEVFFDGQQPLGTMVLETPQFSPEELQVGIDSAVTYGSVYADRIRSLPTIERRSVPDSSQKLDQRNSSLRDDLTRVLAIDAATWTMAPLDESRDVTGGVTRTIRRVPIERFGDRWLTVRTWEIGDADASSRNLVLVGSPDDAANAPHLAALAQHFRVICIEPRDDSEHSNRLQCYGIFTGRPAVGMKVQDVLRAMDVLIPADATAGIIGLTEQSSRWKTGEAGEIALLASVLSPRIRSTTVRLSFLTYKQQALADEFSTDHASIPGILELGDVPQLVAATRGRRVQLLTPPGASRDSTQQELAWIEQTLGATGVQGESSFSIQDHIDTQTLIHWHRNA